MIGGSSSPCRPFPPIAPAEIGEPVRHIEVIPVKHPVVAPEPKTRYRSGCRKKHQ